MQKKYIFYILFIFSTLISSCKSEQISCSNLSDRYIIFNQKSNSSADTLKFLSQIDLLISKDFRCERAYQVGGILYLAKGDFKNSKKYFLKAISKNDSSIYSLYILSSLYNIEDKNDTALSYINTALLLKAPNKIALDKYSVLSRPSFDIEFSKLIFLRGIIYYETNNYLMAKNDFLSAYHHRYDKVEICQYLESVYHELGNKDSSQYYHKICDP